MRITTLIASAIIVLATSIGSASAADELATLNGVKATPMAASELDAVKGLHIHGINPHGKLILLGGPRRYDNGSEEAANGEMFSVHNGYHGFCVAGPIGVPPIGPGGVGTDPQC